MPPIAIDYFLCLPSCNAWNGHDIPEELALALRPPSAYPPPPSWCGCLRFVLLAIGKAWAAIRSPAVPKLFLTKLISQILAVRDSPGRAYIARTLTLCLQTAVPIPWKGSPTGPNVR